MQACPKCGNGDPILKPGSSASGLFCLGCGTRLIPDPATPTQVIAADATQLSAADIALSTMQKTLATVMTGKKKAEADLLDANANLAASVARTNMLQAELGSIREALVHAGLEPPPAPVVVSASTPALIATAPASTPAPIATAQTAAPAVDFHGVPLPTK